MKLAEKLDRVVTRHEELAALAMAAPDVDPQRVRALSKEYSELTPVVDSDRELRASRRTSSTTSRRMRDDAGDRSRDEGAGRSRSIPTLKAASCRSWSSRSSSCCCPRTRPTTRNAILEVRAGTGGDEAALFAAELFRMYQRYAALHGWKFEIMELSETGIGGYKEAIGRTSTAAACSRG